MNPRGDWREGLPDHVERPRYPAVGAVQFDSRDVLPGDLFVAITGERFDGHDFAAAAVAAGAAALVVQTGRASSLSVLDVPIVELPDPRRTLSSIAAAHEGFPADKLKVIGVTGTDGKSTTAFFTHAAIEATGEKVGLLSTIESRIGSTPVGNESRLSTQEAPVVQRLLADMVDAGCGYAVIEATSHGLALHRLDECRFDVGVLTNVTADHLDFHGSMAVYRAAKARLFQMLDEPAELRSQHRAVLNADDASWTEFADATRAPVLTYALDTDADVRATDIEAVGPGSAFRLSYNGESVGAQVRLPGRFNVANATAALSATIALGLDPRLATIGISQCPGVPGRMERILTSPIGVVVDYAHTGEALTRVLELLRPLIEGRLIVVFGAAGERARERRRDLGRIAAALADFAVLTEEDPRSESTDEIVGEIARSMREAGARERLDFERVPDRRDAIRRGIAIAEPGDVVLIAGKGHESTIERADGSHPWDDRAEARAAVAERFDVDTSW